MGKARSKNPEKEAGAIPSENVIQLGAFRNRHADFRTHSLFYLNEGGRWLDLLTARQSLEVENIQSADGLKVKLLRRDPELVLLESGIRWGDPLETIKQLDYLLEVPIVMICDAQGGENSQLIKQAYSAGVYDVLFTPLKNDELNETLDVLLKFQRHVSLHQ